MTTIKRLLLLCTVLIVGCDYPPGEAAGIREQLQAQISKGQVYLNHTAVEVSFVIKNSELNKRPEADRKMLVNSVEKEILAILARYKKYKRIKIYFLGAGTNGIDTPYICNLTDNACKQEKAPA